MSRINTNVQSLIAQRNLGAQNYSLNKSLERLSTGLRINRGADDPAGLIASEALRSEQAKITSAISNAERADQVVNIAEGGLQEISSLLLEVQSLVGQSANDAGLSADEKEANQLQIDSILQTIDRISQTTSFQGTKLLNGTYDFTVSSQASSVTDFTINAAKLSPTENRQVDILVNTSAQYGGLFLSTNGALDLTANSSTFTFEVNGALGSREFTFTSGTALGDIASEVNKFTEVTGVSAATSGTGLVFKTDTLGSDQFVEIDIVDDGGQVGTVFNLSATDNNTSQTTGGTTLATLESSNAIRDEGQDLGATVNGISATARGNILRVNSDFLDLEATLTVSGSQTLGDLNAGGALTITGGGAQFNIGPNVDVLNQATLGIKNVASRNLGSVQNGYLADLANGESSNVVDGNLNAAQKIVDDAISQIASLRGRLGAFQRNTLGATISNLGVAFENTSAAESSIRDTDFAAETAELTRSQILQQAATSSLAIANSAPSAVLSLLG
ncbi:MAG: flagellin [Planctomycetota bacterium]